MRFLRSPKCSKTIVELTFTTQKAKPRSLLDCLFCSVVSFLGKFGPKTQNCQFKLTFVTQNNSKMQNYMVMFTFPLFDWIYLFWVNLVQKNQNCQFELIPRLKFLFQTRKTFLGKFGPENQNFLFKEKFDTKTNSNMQN